MQIKILEKISSLHHAAGSQIFPLHNAAESQFSLLHDAGGVKLGSGELSKKIQETP
jgi:hypothetical protein